MTEREYLTFDDALRDHAVRALFDAAVVEVESGTAVVENTYPPGVVTAGRKILGSGLLKYRIGIGAGPAETFSADATWRFVEHLRKLLGWNELHYALTLWVEERLRDPFFVNEGSDWDERWALMPRADVTGLPDSFFDFACKVAIGELKYGPSYASVTANRIFGWLDALGSDLPTRLKKHGTGELPTDLAKLRSESVTITANDALAVIRVAVKKESADAYEVVLDYLVRLFENTDFPRSYAIEFRGPAKVHLPIPGLPKKGVHRLFAAAVAYPQLHPLIERYARAVMREYEWYQNLEDEQCAMPGTFAVFALGLRSSQHAQLVLDYLGLVDGEHQSLQAKFVEAYVDAHGASYEALAYLVSCAGNIQHLRHRKTYPALLANRDSLTALLSLRHTGAEPSSIATLRANLDGEATDEHAWRAVLFTLWGEAVEDGRRANIVAAAPEELRSLYEQIFADER
jgi:hypothetical protein